MVRFVQFRMPTQYNDAECRFVTLEAAVTWGKSKGTPFDVSNESGAIVWAWEMRNAVDATWCPQCFPEGEM